MGQRFGGRDGRQVGGVPVPERPTAGGEDETRDVLHSFPAQALPDGRMLAVDGSEPVQAGLRVAVQGGAGSGGRR